MKIGDIKLEALGLMYPGEIPAYSTADTMGGSLLELKEEVDKIFNKTINKTITADNFNEIYQNVTTSGSLLELKEEVDKFFNKTINKTITADNFNEIYQNVTTSGYANILSDYSEILARMTGSLARCLDVIAERRVLPVKRVELYLTNAARNGRAYRFEKPGDCYDVDRVIMQAENAYDGDYPYRMEGETLVLHDPDMEASFSLLYHPTVTPPSVWENDAELVGVPDELARLIPYFIKGELFREEEPGEAAEAMAWFEQRLASIAQKRTEKQSKVASVYAQEAL